MSVEIKKVESCRDLRIFSELPNKFYKGNKYYVPTLAADDRKTFDKKENPSFEVCEADYFLAYKDGKVVGRIAAILNRKANEVWGKKSARFGWIDFIDDEEVSSALISTAENWAREHGMDSIEGPLGFTDSDTEGMLVEGYEEDGTMVTFYNAPYYKEHLEKLGYSKVVDWVERRVTIPDVLPEKYTRYSAIVGERNGLKAVRYTHKEINEKKIGYKVYDLVNKTYCHLYGFSPLSEKQMDKYVKTYLALLNLDYVSFIVDEQEELVAFGVMLPSMNEGLRKSGGRYFPFGWFYLLKDLKFNHSDTLEMLLIAVRPDLQSKGVPAMLIADLFPRMVAGGFKYAETNPELEDNFAVQNLWSTFENRLHKRRRIYGKQL